MKNLGKKILSIICAIALLIPVNILTNANLFTQVVQGATQVASAADLFALLTMQNNSSSYEQTQDITIKASDSSETLIKTYLYENLPYTFNGTYDGKGYKIIVENTSMFPHGIFHKVTGTIKNLSVKYTGNPRFSLVSADLAHVVGYKQRNALFAVGGIAAYLKGSGKIENCEVTGPRKYGISIYGETKFSGRRFVQINAGGIVGRAEESATIIGNRVSSEIFIQSDGGLYNGTPSTYFNYELFSGGIVGAIRSASGKDSIKVQKNLVENTTISGNVGVSGENGKLSTAIFGGLVGRVEDLSSLKISDNMLQGVLINARDGMYGEILTEWASVRHYGGSAGILAGVINHNNVVPASVMSNNYVNQVQRKDTMGELSDNPVTYWLSNISVDENDYSTGGRGVRAVAYKSNGLGGNDNVDFGNKNYRAPIVPLNDATSANMLSDPDQQYFSNELYNKSNTKQNVNLKWRGQPAPTISGITTELNGDSKITITSSTSKPMFNTPAATSADNIFLSLAYKTAPVYGSNTITSVFENNTEQQTFSFTMPATMPVGGIQKEMVKIYLNDSASADDNKEYIYGNAKINAEAILDKIAVKDTANNKFYIEVPLILTYTQDTTTNTWTFASAAFEKEDSTSATFVWLIARDKSGINGPSTAQRQLYINKPTAQVNSTDATKVDVELTLAAATGGSAATGSVNRNVSITGENKTGYAFLTTTQSTDGKSLEVHIKERVLAAQSLQYTLNHLNNDFNQRVTGNLLASGASSQPSFSHGANDVFTQGSFTINAPQNSKIFYTVSTQKYETPTANSLSASNSVDIVYNSPELDNGGWTNLYVSAIAQQSNNAPSAVSQITYSYKSKPFSTAPAILDGAGSTFINGKYYDPDDTVVTIKVAGVDTLPSNARIKYTLDGTEPSTINGIEYKLNSEISLRALKGKQLATVNVVYIRANYPDSYMGQAKVDLQRGHSQPLVTVTSRSDVPEGKKIGFIIPLNEYPKGQEPDYYVHKGQQSMSPESRVQYKFADIMSSPGDYYPVKEVSEIDNFSFNTSLFPVISYKLGTDPAKTFKVATPEIVTVSIDKDGNEAKAVPQGMEYNDINNTIAIAGAAGTTVKLTVSLVPINNTGPFSESTENTLSYNIWPPTAIVSSRNNKGDDTVIEISPTTTTTLSCATPGAQIFYSFTEEPTYIYNSTTSKYIAGPNSVEYAAGTPIAVPTGVVAGSNFVIYAKARANNKADSALSTFLYKLPDPVQAPEASPRSGDIVRGDKVTLTSTAVAEGASIYYEIGTQTALPKDPVPLVSPLYSDKTNLIINQDTVIKALAYKTGVSSAIVEFTYTLATQVAAPTSSIATGSVVAGGTKIQLSTLSTAANIYYTTDGTDPADVANKSRNSGTTLVLDNAEGKTVNVKAVAEQFGLSSSEMITFSYQICKTDQIVISNIPNNAVVRPDDKITLSTALTGGEIYFTTNGDNPTVSSTKGNVVTVAGGFDAGFVVRAIAVVGGSASVPTTFSYTIVGRAQAPTASIPSGAIISSEVGEVSLAALEGDIYYTSNSVTPTASTGTRLLKGEKIKLTQSVVIKAIAITAKKAPSDVATFVYTMADQVAAPVATPADGEVVVNTLMTLACSTPNAEIFYSTNQDAPSTSNASDWTPYKEPVKIQRGVTIYMFAQLDGWRSSVINRVSYTVIKPLPEPEAPEQQEEKMPDDLFLFGKYGNSVGPSFSDILKTDASTLVLISAETDAVPDDVVLSVVQRNSPDKADIEAVKRAHGLFLASLYDITLLVNNAKIQPQDGKGIEVGIPIPDGLENTVLRIAHITENGVVELLETRRDGKMLFAIIKSFSKYAVVAPMQIVQDEATDFSPQILIILSALLFGITIMLIIKKRKQQHEKTLE